MSIDQLQTQIMNQFKQDISLVKNSILENIEVAKGKVSASLIIPDTPRYTANPTITPARVAEGILPSVIEDSENLIIRFWNIGLLESVSTTISKGYNDIPIWSMLNWGSGYKVHVTSKTRGLDSVSVADYLRYSIPFRKKYKSVAQTMTKPPVDVTPSRFLWVVKRGAGDRGEGYYTPVTILYKIKEYRQKHGKGENITTQPMAYYTAQFYIEKSVSTVIGKLRELLNGSNLIKKNPLR